MDLIIRLKVPAGMHVVAHGEATYPVRDGIVEVPERLAAQLLRSHGGFAEVGRRREVPALLTLPKRARA
jgi:hypothetical protein